MPGDKQWYRRGTFTLEVDCSSTWVEQKRPSTSPQAQAKVDVFEVEKEALVEATNLDECAIPHHDERS